VDTIGHHYIAEASGCDPNVIGKVESVEQILVRAAEVAGVQVWSISFHRFSPNGVSGVVVISESHMSVHTWPEYGYAAVDIFMCGSANADACVPVLREAFGAKRVAVSELLRGQGAA